MEIILPRERRRMKHTNRSDEQLYNIYQLVRCLKRLRYDCLIYFLFLFCLSFLISFYTFSFTRLVSNTLVFNGISKCIIYCESKGERERESETTVRTHIHFNEHFHNSLSFFFLFFFFMLLLQQLFFLSFNIPVDYPSFKIHTYIDKDIEEKYASHS